MNRGKELPLEILTLEYRKIVIKLSDTNFTKPNEANHLCRSGSQHRQQRENRKGNRSK